MSDTGKPERRSSPPLTPTQRAEGLQRLVDSVVEYAIFMLDSDGYIVSWSSGAEHLKGYTADEVIGRHFSCFYTPEDVTSGKPDQELAVAAANGRVEDEGWRVRKDGTRFWANVIITALRDDVGRLTGFGKVTRDITERKRGEDSLRESEERFRLLVTNVTDYAIFMLDPEGRVASWNAGAERLKGYKPDEIIGQNFERFYTAEDVRTGKPGEELARALRDGRVEDEGWRVRKDGTRFWANVIITPLFAADGGLRGYGKITRDLTQRKSEEDALRGVLEREREASVRLRELDHMKNDFVAIVAHDLRSPTTVVAGFADLLLSGWNTLDDGRKRDFVERISRNTKALSALVEDVLDVARIDAGELHFARDPFDLVETVRQAIGEATPGDMGDRVRLQVAPGVDLPQAYADERRTWQVLVNLLANALKYSPASEPVEIRVGLASDAGDGSAGLLQVSVIDHGPGIPESEQAKVFDRFYQSRRGADQQRGGSGLGLFIAKSFVESQGGTIWVDSVEGEGATLSFTLPTVEA